MMLELQSIMFSTMNELSMIYALITRYEIALFPFSRGNMGMFYHLSEALVKKILRNIAKRFSRLVEPVDYGEEQS